MKENLKDLEVKLQQELKQTKTIKNNLEFENKLNKEMIEEI
jgi:hypothetical protein